MIPANRQIWLVAGLPICAACLAALLVESTLDKSPQSGPGIISRSRRGNRSGQYASARKACGLPLPDWGGGHQDNRPVRVRARLISVCLPPVSSEQSQQLRRLHRPNRSMLCEGIEWRRPVRTWTL
jgi:hypothetical protein